MKQILMLLCLFLLCKVTIEAQTTSSVLIENTNIIDVTTGKIKPKQHLLIEGDKIVTISSKKITPKETAIRIDGTDRYVMPGMIDTHIHFFQTGGLYTRPDALDLKHIISYEDEIQFAKVMVPDSFKRYLRLGITSVMDVGGPFYNFHIRDSIAKSNLSPNVYVTGPLFSPYQPEAFSKLEDIPIEKITTIEHATALFNKMLPFRPDFIKIWYITGRGITAEQSYPVVKHISKLTHEHNLKLTVHATNLKTAKLAVQAGADILVHSVRDELVDEEFINLLKKNKVTYIPTLLVSKNYGKSFRAQPDNHPQDLAFANAKIYGTLTDLKKLSDKDIPERIKNLRDKNQSLEEQYHKSDSTMLRNLKILNDNKVNIATGTDAGNIGTMHASSYIQELEAMQKSGMSNMDILKASTVNAATGFGLEKHLGTVEEGKLADLILLDKNPIADIQNLNHIAEVLKDGKVLNIKTLIKETPEEIVQRQVNAYNARDIEAFMDTYAEDIKIYKFPNELSMDSKDEMRKRYEPMFEKYDNLYCGIKNRIVLKDNVIDREYVIRGDGFSEVIAVYKVKDGKISKVTFLK